MTTTRLTLGQRRLRDLAREIEAKTVRLRNKAALVAGEPARGRNLTALRNTLAELHKLAVDLDLAQAAEDL